MKAIIYCLTVVLVFTFVNAQESSTVTITAAPTTFVSATVSTEVPAKETARVDDATATTAKNTVNENIEALNKKVSDMNTVINKLQKTRKTKTAEPKVITKIDTLVVEVPVAIPSEKSETSFLYYFLIVLALVLIYFSYRWFKRDKKSPEPIAEEKIEITTVADAETFVEENICDHTKDCDCDHDHNETEFSPIRVETENIMEVSEDIPSNETEFSPIRVETENIVEVSEDAPNNEEIISTIEAETENIEAVPVETPVLENNDSKKVCPYCGIALEAKNYNRHVYTRCPKRPASQDAA